MNDPEIVAGFQQCAEMTEFMQEQYYSGAVPFLREELVESMSDELVGRSVTIRDRSPKDYEGSSPIQSCAQLGEEHKGWIETCGRTASIRKDPKTKRMYFPNETAWPKRKVRGRIMAIDPERAGVVVRPKGILSRNYRRFWVKMIDENGDPLVDVKFN